MNPELTPQIPAENKYKIYVSALTTISLDDHNWIPTTDNRLLRRIIRDFNYRGYSARETISRWPSVRAGEDKWIFPYQENADVMFNSALLFEFAVLRCHAEPILTSVPRNCPEYAEAYRLLKFIKYFTPVQDKEIPPTSLLREVPGRKQFQILILPSVLPEPYLHRTRSVVAPYSIDTKEVRSEYGEDMEITRRRYGDHTEQYIIPCTLIIRKMR